MNTQRISKRQALLLGVTVVVSGVLNPMFRDLFLWAGNGGWAPIVLATVFSMLTLPLLLLLAKRFPKQSIVESLPQIWGKPLGYALVLTLFIGFLLKAAFQLRHVSEFFVSAVLPETPISAVMIVLAVLLAAGVLAELEGLVRFNELVIPIIIVALVLIFVGSMNRLSGWELLPLFDKGYKNLLQAFMITASYFSNMTMILFLYPLLVDKHDITKAAIRTAFVSGLLFLVVYLNIILSLGSRLGESFTWPYLAVLENLAVGVERSEAIFMVVWLLAAFAAISIFMYLVALGMNQLFPGLKRSWVGLGCIPVITYVALLPKNQPAAVVDHLAANRYTLFLFTGIPLLSLLLAVIRGKRGEQNG